MFSTEPGPEKTTEKNKQTSKNLIKFKPPFKKRAVPVIRTYQNFLVGRPGVGKWPYRRMTLERKSRQKTYAAIAKRNTLPTREDALTTESCRKRFSPELWK